MAINVRKYINYAPWQKTYFSAAIGSPRLHPVKAWGEFITRDGKSYSILKDEGYWGRTFLSDNEFMTPPDSLIIRWADLREREVYEDTVRLPRKRIDHISESPISKKMVFDGYGGPSGYGFHYSIGLAPGGWVTVWMEGSSDFQKIITQFQAKSWDRYYSAEKQEKHLRYALKKMYKTANTQRDSVIANKVPPETEKWAKRRKEFSYYIWLDSLPKIKALSVEFFNEERDLLNFYKKKKILINNAPPSSIASSGSHRGKGLDINYVDSLLFSSFKQEKKQLSSADTLVLLLKRHTVKSKVLTILTNTGKVDSVLNNHEH